MLEGSIAAPGGGFISAGGRAARLLASYARAVTPGTLREAGGTRPSPRIATVLRCGTFVVSVRSLPTPRCAPNTGLSGEANEPWCHDRPRQLQPLVLRHADSWSVAPPRW